MIRLIVSDLDGTLLNSRKEPPKNLLHIIAQLREKGILFAAASGRSRASLLSFFGDLPIPLIADNGGTIYAADGSLLGVFDFSYETAKPVLDTIRETDYMELALVGTKGVFVQADAPEAHKQFTDFFFNGKIEIVPDLEQMFHSDRIVKLSVNTGGDGSNEARAVERMRKFEDHFSLALSGDGWLDLMKKGVGKGSGFVRLCRYYHIALHETMVFGDYLNDLEMLMHSPNSYAMANAHPKVKEACAHVTQFSNNEDGVVRELSRLFHLT